MYDACVYGSMIRLLDECISSLAVSTKLPMNQPIDTTLLRYRTTLLVVMGSSFRVRVRVRVKG